MTQSNSQASQEIPTAREVTAGTATRRPGIIQYLVAEFIVNPGVDRKFLCDKFKVSPQWLSTVINSDAFQAELRLAQEQVNQALLCDVVAHQKGAYLTVLERAVVVASVETDLRKLNETLNNLGDSIGHGPSKARGPQVLVQNNNNQILQGTVPSEVLLRARASFQARTQPRPALILDQDFPKSLPAEGPVSEEPAPSSLSTEERIIALLEPQAPQPRDIDTNGLYPDSSNVLDPT